MPDRLRSRLRAWWAGADWSERLLGLFTAGFLTFCLGFFCKAWILASGPSDGPPCRELAAEEATVFAYEPGPSALDRVNGVVVSGIWGRAQPRCVMVIGRHRCEVTGPTILRAEVHGQRRYFEVPEGRAAVLTVRRRTPQCTLPQDV
ncbi:hypothetical protein [Pseudoroseicyclus sp. CXY001]|uniref:hypothetical protein n=1 Tax=Pseudoroseicyclus sp. CXY001 TaxID=3242492 RepID=UPI003570C89B